MWSPSDPYEPTSELYRLMPPRRPRGQLREALDAAQGIDSPDDDDPIVLISPDLGRGADDDTEPASADVPAAGLHGH